MAEETVVKDALTQEMIDVGTYLVGEIHKTSDIFINAAFWLYDTETYTWKLFIGSPKVKNIGPRKIYEAIQSVLVKKGMDIYIQYFKDIYVIEDDNPLIKAIESSIVSGSKRFEARLSKSLLNSHFIEDAYVIFLFT
jgi:hypothetical protein